MLHNIQQIEYNINIETRERENKKEVLGMENKTISELLNEIEETDKRMNKLMQSLGYKDIIEAGEEAEEILKIIGEGNC